MSSWLANMAAVRVEPIRAISVHVSLTPPTVVSSWLVNVAALFFPNTFYFVSE